MDNYQIIMNDGIDENTKEIIEKYWLIENNEFKYSFKYFQEKYALNQNILVKLIKSNSYCLKKVSCNDCNDFFQIKIETKSNFKDSRYGNVCTKCEELRKLKRIEIEQESKRINDENLAYEVKKREEKMSKVVERKLWLTLNIDDLTILQKFVRLNEMSLIRKYLYNELTSKEIKYYETMFQDFGFIYFPSYQKNIVEFAPNFETEILNYKPIKELHPNTKMSENLRFTLAKKIEKTSKTQGDYAGTFTLPNDVILKANQLYVYGGWIQPNGSLSISFTPAKDLNSTIQTKFDEPFPTGFEQTNSFNNDFNDEDAPF